jgi:hypothetical protein
MMKRWSFLWFAGLLVLSSCTNYQYVRLTSDLPKTEDTGHYYASDSLVYADFDFNGDYFPVKLYFLNESEGEVELDLTKSVFLENDVVVSNAYKLLRDANEEVSVPAGKAVAFEFFPYRSFYQKDLKAQSGYVELHSGAKRVMVSGLNPKGEGRSFEIHLIYRGGTKMQDEFVLKAEFKEDFIYFSEREPVNFPGGTEPDVYYVSRNSESGQVAADLFVELATLSLFYYLSTR